MKNRTSAANLPKPLYQAMKRFERWRRTHQPRARFSEELWSTAVTMARDYGHSRTASALGLDYYSLKKRIGADKEPARSEKSAGAWPFVELIPPAQTECAIEIEDGKGRKMRISFKGGEMPDLASMSRGFLEAGA